MDLDDLYRPNIIKDEKGEDEEWEILIQGTLRGS